MRLSAFRVPRYPISAAAVGFLVVFLVLFPKGGVKVGNVPITWGYLALLFSLPLLLPFRLLATPPSLRWSHLATIAATVPFSVVFLYSYRANGVLSPGFAASTFINLVVLPYIFVLLYPGFYNRVDGVRLAGLFRFCILAAALFGIFLFFWHPITGHYIEIPYLTVNADDFGQLETTKHIDRGLFFKLISTYNNGNLYGVATLILMPMYDQLEPRRWKRIVLKIALVLTLSRTVWAGLIIEQILSLLWSVLQSAHTFPKVIAGPALRRGAAILATVAVVLVGFAFTARDIQFIFDSEFGGRRGEFDVFLNSTWFPSVPIDAFAEVLYGSALYLYGIVGLLAFCLLLGSPLLVWLGEPGLVRSPLRKAALKGLILYMILAWADGGLNYIPMMAFYWFATMIFLGGWPGTPGRQPPVQRKSRAFHPKPASTAPSLAPSGS